MQNKILKGIFVIGGLILLVLVLLGGYQLLFNRSKYDKNVTKILKDNNLNKYVTVYSKTLDMAIKENNFDVKYVDEYLKINYQERNNFWQHIQKYLEIGYNGDEINSIYKLSELNQKKLLTKTKQDFSKFQNIKNFDVDNIKRYNQYLNITGKDVQTVVTQVNLKLDLPVYTDTEEVKNADSTLVIVNKYNYLPKNYKPKDLVYLDGAYGNKVPVREIVKEPFLKLQEAAKKEININLMPSTAFRNELFQTTLYNNYVASDGVEKADTYSARPGYSEHQTGLAIDLRNTALKDVRLTDEDYEWLENNSYKYGFIIRFPKEKEEVTGYQFENWHIRYVGIDLATKIYNSKLCLEEYYDMYLKEY